MKINIWINKREAVSGNITKYYNVAPQSSDWPDYVQVTVSQDEFARLEDRGYNRSRKLTWSELDELSMKEDAKIYDGDDWLVEQYNRNRLPEDQIKSRDEIPYIHERNPDTGEIKSRRVGDYGSERIGLSERVYTEEKELKELMEEMKDKTGEEFPKWFYSLTKNEQTKLAAYYND